MDHRKMGCLGYEVRAGKVLPLQAILSDKKLSLHEDTAGIPPTSC